MVQENIAAVNRLKLQRLAKKLENNNFAVTLVETKEEAAAFIQGAIPEGSSVGVGGSVTLDELGLIDWLRQQPGIRFIDRYTMEDKKQAFRESMFADVYLMSSNAITMDGYLYNVDGNGNRVAALIYGPDQVYVIAGVHKVVRDLEDAKHRVEQIAGPVNNVRLNKDNPCVKLGECAHCNHATTICNQYVISRRSGTKGRIHVVLVNEELGY